MEKKYREVEGTIYVDQDRGHMHISKLPEGNDPLKIVKKIWVYDNGDTRVYWLREKFASEFKISIPKLRKYAKEVYENTTLTSGERMELCYNDRKWWFNEKTLEFLKK